jgi:hypothetical protein
MQWKNPSNHDINFDGLDPYAAWLISDSGRFAFPSRAPQSRIYPLTIELENISESDNISIADFSRGIDLFESVGDRQRWQESIVIPKILTEPPEGLKGIIHSLRFVTAVANSDFFDILRNRDNTKLRKHIRSITISRSFARLPALDAKERQLPPAFDVAIDRSGAHSGEVIVGIIDDGIAFAHERFRNGSMSTRIASIWLQSDTMDKDSPALFAHGREIKKKELNKLLADLTSNGRVDEDRVYKEAGVLDFASPAHKSLARRVAHGTHVLDVATGPRQNDHPQWPIVCVQLPDEVTADTSGTRLTQWALEGVWYILLQSIVIAAERGCRPLPVVINLSYGFTAGPHDGGHPLERALKEAVDVWERITGAAVRIVLPAGNNLQSRLHARIKFDQSQVIELPWRIHPDDRTASHVEIWLPKRTSDAPCPVRVRVCPPGPSAAASPSISHPGTRTSELKSGEQVVCQIHYTHMGESAGHGVVRISVAPTFELERSKQDVERVPLSPGSVAPHGVWRIQIENIGLEAGEEVHAWIQRDDTAFGYPSFGRQSYFDDPEYWRFDERGDIGFVDNPESLVSRAGTLNAIATGNDPRIVVVGGYTHTSRRATLYSSRGPTLGTRRGCDVLAASDRSRVFPGVLAAGTRSGSTIAMNGTSVAAPGATRLIAEELAAGRAGDATWLASSAHELHDRAPEAAEGTIPFAGDGLEA